MCCNNDACCNAADGCTCNQTVNKDYLLEELNKVSATYTGLSKSVLENIKTLLLELSNSDICDIFLQSLYRELNVAEHNMQSKITTDMFVVASLLKLLEYYDNFNNYRVKSLIDFICDDIPMTRLTFTDDDFSEESVDPSDNVCLHHNREYAIYKDIKSGDISYIYALKLMTIGTVDLDSNEQDVIESIYSEHTHSGCFYVYDSDSMTWSRVSCIQKINTKSDFYKQSFVVPVIELYNSKDTKNDYYAFITDIKNIPSEFYQYYEFTTATLDEDDKEIIEYLEKNRIARLLISEIKQIDYINSVDYTEDSIVVHYKYMKFKKKLKDQLAKYGIGYEYAKISEKFLNDELVITLKNEPEIIEVVESFLN